MELTVGTSIFQNMLAKAVKGAGYNEAKPVTTLVAIKLKDGTLTLTTTDATNYLCVTEKDIAGDNFYIAVRVDVLAKLVSKITSKTITLKVDEGVLTIIGNGSYKMGIPLEDDGTPAVLPNPIDKFYKAEEVGTVHSSVIANVLKSVKPALSTDKDYPQYHNYYVGDSILASDTYTITDYSEGFLEDAKLVSPFVMDLLGLFTGEIRVFADDKAMLFVADNGMVFGAIPDGIENYSSVELGMLVSQVYAHSCKVSRVALLGLLDRISLFVVTGSDDKPKNGRITLRFGKEYLEITSPYASERIEYLEREKADDFECDAEINTLATQVKAQSGEEITIEYGEDNAIKIIDGDVTTVVGLMVATPTL